MRSNMQEIKKLIDGKIGLIKVFDEENISCISPETVTLGGEVLFAGQKTTLNDFFNSEVVYLGIHERYMQFKIGEQHDLFSHEIWTNEFKKIDENRIMTIYSHGTARDFIFKNGVWK